MEKGSDDLYGVHWNWVGEKREEMIMKKLRLAVQLIFTILTNGYAYGYLNGKIYQGTFKYACVPGLNCYSCAGAVASCPIGSLQALLTPRCL